VVHISTGLSPEALLQHLHRIESERGRRRGSEPNRPRTLDLDLLLFGDERIDLPGLVVPHPRLHERAFVLEPLREVAASWRHPVLGETIAVLADRMRDPVRVRHWHGTRDGELLKTTKI
jgi:2-amino-4-hydroxy-6-hydroxymethyldihydropteridine diphosphokinase